MAEPFLDLGDFRLVVEGVRCRGRAERVGADFEAQRAGIVAHEPVDAIWCDRFSGTAIAFLGQAPEQCAVRVAAVPGSLQIIEDEGTCNWVKWDVAHLVSLTGDNQIRDAATLVTEVLDRESAKFLSAEGVIEQGIPPAPANNGRSEIPAEAKPQYKVPRSPGRRETVEEKLLRRQAEIAARLHVIATTRKVETREKEARLDRIIGAACRADKTIHESVKAALKGVKSPADREFLKTEGWL